MSNATLLSNEQARALKKSRPAKRTQERYKYVNAAVAQASILGIDKLVFITMCEFADDSGLLWHGERSLATATKLAPSTVHDSIQRLIAAGVVMLLHKGASKWDTNLYRVVEMDGWMLRTRRRSTPSQKSTASRSRANCRSPREQWTNQPLGWRAIPRLHRSPREQKILNLILTLPNLFQR